MANYIKLEEDCVMVKLNHDILSKAGRISGSFNSVDELMAHLMK